MTAALLALVLALSPQDYEFDLLGTPQGFEVTQELLDEALAAAKPAVEKALGYGVSKEFAGARFASAEELYEILVRENVPLIQSQIEDKHQAKEQAEAFADSVAVGLFAKYAFIEDVILFSPEGFKLNAEELGMPGLLGMEVVQAILVHELVHAADQNHLDVRATMLALGDADRIQTLNAAFEGHAQHIARRVCGELGWQKGFDQYTAATQTAPKSEGEDGEAMRLLRRLQREATAQLYSDGEAFIAAVEKAAGKEGVQRALRKPPRDFAEIIRPGWFLHPERRPKTHFDLNRGLDVFEKVYKGRGWVGARSPFNTAQIGQAFTGLPKQVVKRLQRSFRAGHVHQLTKSEAESMHYAFASEWSSSGEAAFAVGATRSLLKLRDEAMTEGTIRILEAVYTEVDEESIKGFVSKKRVDGAGTELTVVTLVAASGPISIEVVRTNEVGTRESLIELGKKILAEAQVEEPKEPKEGSNGSKESGTSGGEEG